MFFQVTKGEISVEKAVEMVKTNEMGAVVTFVGTVRAFSRGRKVRHLEFDVSPEEVEEKLREIGEEIAGRWGTERLAVLQKIGRLLVGEKISIIAVATPHRAEAFAACQYAIDRMKETLHTPMKEIWEESERAEFIGR